MDRTADAEDVVDDIRRRERLDKRIGHCAYNMSKNITALTYELNLGFVFGGLGFHDLIMKIFEGAFVPSLVRSS